jgi:GNAT superfamily N-acetyltransferase
MAASDNLSKGQFPYTYKFRTLPDAVNSDPAWEVTAHHQGKQVGYLNWAMAGHVYDMNVDPEHRRKGVATGMWNHALAQGGKHDNNLRQPISHAEHSAHRTLEGDAWAKSTGKAHYFPAEEIH